MPLDADDITAIVNLAHEYNEAVDRQDPHAWVQTYTVEGELCSPLGNPKGHEALFEWISRFVASAYATCHCNVNEVVDGNGDEATMRSSYIVIRANKAPPAIVVTGGYEDELARVDGHWRFARRMHTLDASYGVVDEHPRE
jgi:hypothetical protein